MHEGQLFKTCTDSQPLAGSGARPLSFIATRAPHIVVDRINFTSRTTIWTSSLLIFCATQHIEPTVLDRSSLTPKGRTKYRAYSSAG